ncbi:methyltransferase domain-containing protein [Nonomuraea ferruginea]|uniref:Protein-L-isoaspartate O-methyltransferase n=1 Tax=Nonomuraea ferruginea TaxID=46174 RepID=A0ABT4T9Z6_9ACTN|nr:methyltransferase domain-containing protein [Nonomuraea ferruginea]MDA0646342.1 methyltransferase domain-containing protein [Nonomuraea ferruginea]
MDWKERAEALAAIATPPGSRWRAPVARTPRHTFVPNWWEPVEGGWARRDGASNPGQWLKAAYTNATLVTRIGPLHADHADPGARASGRPTSSSTLPGLVAQMFRHASIDDSCTVLDVGAGSGYGTAVLCARLGDERVTAIDVDPYLVGAARRRLGEAGYEPRLIAGDATRPLDGQWDRIVATVSVRPIPPSWLAALHTGGRLATTISGMGVILTAEKKPDGTATGRIERDQAMFMGTRTGADYPQAEHALLDRARVEEGERVERGRYPVVLDVVEAWDVRTMLEINAPGITHHHTRENGIRIAIMVHPDGSWARAEERDGEVIVHQSGPRRLWDYLDEVRDHWIRHGLLPFHGAKVLIRPDGGIELRRGRWTATIGLSSRSGDQATAVGLGIPWGPDQPGGPMPPSS